MFCLLHIDASSLGEASVSHQVARSFRDDWKGADLYLFTVPMDNLTVPSVFKA